MSQTATRPSTYNNFEIEVKNTNNTTGVSVSKVDLSPSIAEFRYYEDICSPVITASATVMATGNVSIGKNRETLIGGLPIVGNEKFSISIQDNMNGPSLTLDKLINNGVSDIVTSNNRESFTLNMISKDSLNNHTKKVEKVLKNNTVTNHVFEVLDILSDDAIVQTADLTVGSFSYKGNGRKPFTVILNLAARARTEPIGGNGKTGASAGCFFWETSEGYRFRSIDSLIFQEPSYKYTEVNTTLSYTDPQGIDLNMKILAKNVVENNDIWGSLNYGVYSSERYIWDALNGQMSTLKVEFTPEEYVKNTNNLGSENQLLDDPIFKLPSRKFVSILNTGATEKGGTREEKNPIEYLSQTAMRYNALMTQVINIIVPSNLSLHAGDVIVCDFPVPGKSEIDQKLSGKYLIKELCHYFSQSESYTSLKIVRDTYGRSTGKNTK